MRVTYVRGNKDHPRVYGENSGCCAYPLMMVGSPPRIRGKHPANPAIHDGTGITPAYTGKTHARGTACKSYRDHPRVYGENAKASSIKIVFKGSPPRIRGKRLYCPLISSVDRITPAYTGKTCSRSCLAVGHRDHPRVYGENYAQKRLITVDRGSPPRIRGKRRLDC